VPRYLIRRNWGTIDDEEMHDVGEANQRVIAEHTPDVVWEVSHVVAAPSGEILSYCIYSAPDEGRLREHAAFLGHHSIEEIYEIGGDVSPHDFPSP
jgi:hypothetical protein